MSIYKGGYILADISDTPLTDIPQDLLTQDLKDYLSKFLDKSNHWKTEILSKPLNLIIKISGGYILRLIFNTISDDLTELYATYINIDYSVCVRISQDLKIYCLDETLTPAT